MVSFYLVLLFYTLPVAGSLSGKPQKSGAAFAAPLSLSKNHVRAALCSGMGGGARGGGSPPRMKWNPLKFLRRKDFSEQSEDFFDSLYFYGISYLDILMLAIIA